MGEDARAHELHRGEIAGDVLDACGEAVLEILRPSREQRGVALDRDRMRHDRFELLGRREQPRPARVERELFRGLGEDDDDCAALNSPSGPLDARSVNGDSYSSAPSIVPCSVR